MRVFMRKLTQTDLAQEPFGALPPFLTRDSLELQSESDVVERRQPGIERRLLKFGDPVRSKSHVGQLNEVLCRVLCHTICVSIQGIHEFGIAPTFGKHCPL